MYGFDTTNFMKYDKVLKTNSKTLVRLRYMTSVLITHLLYCTLYLHIGLSFIFTPQKLFFKHMSFSEPPDLTLYNLAQALLREVL